MNLKDEFEKSLLKFFIIERRINEYYNLNEIFINSLSILELRLLVKIWFKNKGIGYE